MSNKKRRNRSRQRPSGPPAARAADLARPGNERALAEATLEVSEFRGPLPPPEMLAQYDSIVPGFAERLLAEFTEQGTHRRGLEALVITSNVKAQSRGQVIGATLFIVGIVAAVTLGLADKTAAAVAIAAMDFGGFGAIYVWGRHQQQKERTS